MTAIQEMKTRRIETEVLTVLSAASIIGNVVKLPATQLERKLYERVNAVLADLGGKWKTKVGHIFPEDPTERLEAALLSGQVISPKLNGFFPTPPELVLRMLEIADIDADHWVLEPSAGDGAIADVISATGCMGLTLVELLPEHRTLLERKQYVVEEEPDFLKWEPKWRYDRVVMNPPFSKQQDIDHVTKAFSHLAPGGRLIAIMAAGITFRQDRKTVAFMNLLAHAHGTFEKNPADSFRASGTSVNTVLVSMEAAR